MSWEHKGGGRIDIFKWKSDFPWGWAIAIAVILLIAIAG